MKYLLIMAILVSGKAYSLELERSSDAELAHILSTMKILYENNSFPMVQVIQSWEAVSECGGSFESCPSARLFITSSMGDLDEAPLLYELPKSKGWELVSTEKKERGLYISIITTLDHANVNAESREKWQSKKYVVRVSPETGTVHLVN